MISDLIDFDTLLAVKKAAPKVTTVPFNIACYVVRAMAEISKSRMANIDSSGHMKLCDFWLNVILAVIALIALLAAEHWAW